MRKLPFSKRDSKFDVIKEFEVFSQTIYKV